MRFRKIIIALAAFSALAAAQQPVVRNSSKPYVPSEGLYSRNIALWGSHGWYYSHDRDRWEFQRPRLFQSVEDLLTQSIVIPYLIPMLENAGASVFTPRERDIQTLESVADNDAQTIKETQISAGSYKERTLKNVSAWQTSTGKGFALGTLPYKGNFNPFSSGTFRQAKTEKEYSCEACWTPKISMDGNYAVYISYASVPSGISDAHYIVNHSGGKTEFRVDQKKGGGTWIYLGNFFFKKDAPSSGSSVVLRNDSSEPGKTITADAVRFGGGTGLIEREGTVSQRPKYTEAARYFLQYAGMPDSLVYSFNGSKDDYKDDKQCRAEYVNYLIHDLNIKIDLSFALHTDAGIARAGKTIGSLIIYSTQDDKGSSSFSDGKPRDISTSLARTMNEQLTGDIRRNFGPLWNSRGIRNVLVKNDAYPMQYSEVYRPDAPSLLVELLSHQNFTDMRLMSDPDFKFTASRAIYKAMLKFLSAKDNTSYTVQPLPVKAFSTSFNNNGGITLKWHPQYDTLEKTASPEKYIVYTASDGSGFDNGTVAADTSFTLARTAEGVVYSFKVTAVNKGGESFPSEILSACRMPGAGDPVLIVNGYDRLAGPEASLYPGFEGFRNDLDEGEACGYKIDLTGAQYDFNPASPYISNDAPGLGASHADTEGKIIAGNTFNYPYIHGQSLKSCGLSFISASAGSVERGDLQLKNFKNVDLIIGKQRAVALSPDAQGRYSPAGISSDHPAFAPALQRRIEAFLTGGGNLIVSGSFIGSDLFGTRTRGDSLFALKTLRFSLDAGLASKTGKVQTSGIFSKTGKEYFSFNTGYSDKIYSVKSPDALIPANGSEVILRYKENQFGAATGYKKNGGVICVGFPLETVTDSAERDRLMKLFVDYLGIVCP